MNSPCDDLIARIEEEVSSTPRDDRTRAFFIEACGEMEHLLPPQGARWMEVAAAYAQGAARRRELNDAFLETLEVVGADLQGMSSPRNAAVNAVAFALMPDEAYDSWIETMSLFIDLCERAGMGRTALCGRLHVAFEDVLE
jgi:hypothetical protein